MKYRVLVPVLYLSEVEVEADSPTDAFRKVLEDKGEREVVSLKISNIVYPECAPDQVMWDVKDEKGNVTTFIDTDGSHV